MTEYTALPVDRMTEAEDRWQFACYAWLGIPPAVIGAALAFYFYAFASMVDPRLVLK